MLLPIPQLLLHFFQFIYELFFGLIFVFHNFYLEQILCHVYFITLFGEKQYLANNFCLFSDKLCYLGLLKKLITTLQIHKGKKRNILNFFLTTHTERKRPKQKSAQDNVVNLISIILKISK